MKKIVFVLIIGCFVSVTNAQNEISIDTSKSLIKWTGSNLFKFNKHYGIVKFKNGILYQTNDSITGGKFEIDMNSLVNTDGKYNEMLVDHLKSIDFFDVRAYPNSNLEITEIKYSDSVNLDIKAKLKIKNSTQTIAYQATIENSGNRVLLKSQFILDRTRWKINYESKGVTNSLKDAIISDAIEFEVILTGE